jgi:hypothetical protein
VSREWRTHTRNVNRVDQGGRGVERTEGRALHSLFRRQSGKLVHDAAVLNPIDTESTPIDRPFGNPNPVFVSAGHIDDVRVAK